MQDIEMQDMMTIVHGLKMSGLASIEPDALDPINERIKNLPSSEEIPEIYTSGREVERLCTEVGRIMELIDYYGTKSSEYTSRYKAKTGLPPRYKNLEWKKAGTKNMRINKKAEMDAFTDASTQMEAMISELYDIPQKLDTIISESESFSQNFNNNFNQMIQMVPQSVQPSLMQYVGILNESTAQVVETANLLKGHINTIQQASQGVSGVAESTQESYQTYMANVASTDYIKGIVKLSSNMEGNGIVSEKLLAYAKCLSNNDPQGYYAALEVRSVLRQASFNKEADTLMKTAGIWDKAKGAWQGAKSGYEAGKSGGQAGIIDPGVQDQPEWQTGDIETQFNNDVDWLKRSWDNLVDFFTRYVRDAEILVKEWAGKDEKKVAKIVELRDQANVLLGKVKDIQGSGNFSEKMMGPNLFGGDGDKETNEVATDEETLKSLMNADFKNVDWGKVDKLLNIIETWQKENPKTASSNAVIKEAGIGDFAKDMWGKMKGGEEKVENPGKNPGSAKKVELKWKAVGVDPSDVNFNNFLTKNWGHNVDVPALRALFEKVKRSLGVATEEEDPNKPDPNKPDPNKPDPNKPGGTPQIEGRSNEQVLQESGDQALAPYLEGASDGIQHMINGSPERMTQDDWNKLKILVSKLQTWQRANEQSIFDTYGARVANGKANIKTAISQEMMGTILNQFKLLMNQKWHEIDSAALGRSVQELQQEWINKGGTTSQPEETAPQAEETAPSGDQLTSNPQLGDQGNEYYLAQVKQAHNNTSPVFKKILSSNESDLVSVTRQEWESLGRLINAIGMYQQQSKTKSAKNTFNLKKTSKFEGKEDFLNTIKSQLSKGDYINIDVNKFKMFMQNAYQRQQQLVNQDPKKKMM